MSKVLKPHQFKNARTAHCTMQMNDTELPFKAPAIFFSSIFLVCIGFNHLSMK